MNLIEEEEDGSEGGKIRIDVPEEGDSQWWEQNSEKGGK
jgi:hypothetical protein